jgi:hypothetical protein
MGVGSGLGGSVGIGIETTYGTYVAPTTFPEVHSAKFEPKPNFAQGTGLAAGRALDPAARYVQTHREASGSLELEVLSTRFGKYLAHIMGSSSTPVVQAATAAYLQTHVLGADNKGKSFSVQVKSPNLTDTVLPITYTGCKVTSLDLDCGVGDLLVAKMDVDAQDYSNVTALAATSYPVGARPFNFADMTVKVGVFGSEASVSGVRKVSLKIARKQKLDQQYAGAAGKKSEPTANGTVEITGSIETDYVNSTDFYDRRLSGASFSLVFEWVGPVIASTYFQTIRFTLPGTIITDGAPALDGPDVVNPTYSFKVTDDGVNTAKVEYMSTDVTVL